MRLKGLVAKLVTTMMLFVACSTGIASQKQVYASVGVTPYWTNVSSIFVTLAFSGTTAYCDATVGAFSGTTKIAATVKLERKDGNNYTAVKTWTSSSASTSLNFAESHAVTKGYTYRLTVSVDVTRNGVTETASNWVENTLK